MGREPLHAVPDLRNAEGPPVRAALLGEDRATEPERG
jgi:hypothetical protein